MINDHTHPNLGGPNADVPERIKAALQKPGIPQGPIQTQFICPQCGQQWSDRACGPTHAVIWHNREFPPKHIYGPVEDKVK